MIETPRTSALRAGMKGLMRLFALVLCLLALPVFSAPRIGILTMQPGEVFWERFGHDAIVVDDPLDGAISYNYGFFDPTEDDFILRFIRGQMRYQLVALPLELDLAQYRENGRGVTVQWLNLQPAEAERLAAFLAENARPENASYHYDYFRNNCATRVRDALDAALDGQLAQQLRTRSDATYRSETTRLAAPANWMWAVFEFGLGPSADQPLSEWQLGFIPMQLARQLEGVQGSDGRPLVESRQALLPHHLPAEPQTAPTPIAAFSVAGLLLAALLLLLGHNRPRLLASLALIIWLALGTLGSILLYGWLGTAHWALAGNHNLLLANPLALLLVPGTWQLCRQRPVPGHFRWLRRIVLLSALASLPLAAIPITTQNNTLWIALLLPIHVALFIGTGKAAKKHA